MRKVIAILFVAAIVLAACSPSEMQQYRKERDSRWSGGLYRTYKIYTPTGELLDTYEGLGYIDDNSGSGNTTLLLTSENKKVDVIGPAIMISTEVTRK